MLSVRFAALVALAATAAQAQHPGQNSGAHIPDFTEVQNSVSENWSSVHDFITSGLPVLERIRASEYKWLTSAFGGTEIPTTYDHAWVSHAILGGAFGKAVAGTETMGAGAPTATDAAAATAESADSTEGSQEAALAATSKDADAAAKLAESGAETSGASAEGESGSSTLPWCDEESDSGDGGGRGSEGTHSKAGEGTTATSKSGAVRIAGSTAAAVAIAAAVALL